MATNNWLKKLYEDFCVLFEAKGKDRLKFAEIAEKHFTDLLKLLISLSTAIIAFLSVASLYAVPSIINKSVLLLSYFLSIVFAVSAYVSLVVHYKRYTDHATKDEANLFVMWSGKEYRAIGEQIRKENDKFKNRKGGDWQKTTITLGAFSVVLFFVSTILMVLSGAQEVLSPNPGISCEFDYPYLPDGGRGEIPRFSIFNDGKSKIYSLKVYADTILFDKKENKLTARILFGNTVQDTLMSVKELDIFDTTYADILGMRENAIVLFTFKISFYSGKSAREYYVEKRYFTDEKDVYTEEQFKKSPFYERMMKEKQNKTIFEGLRTMKFQKVGDREWVADGKKAQMNVKVP